MHAGFVPDYGPVASVLTATFVQGTPEAREGRWEKIQKGVGVKAWPREAEWVLTGHRCELCGKVEFYATERPDSDVTLEPRE